MLDTSETLWKATTHYPRSLSWSVSGIVYSGGVAITQSAPITLTVSADGSYSLTGGMHDSGGIGYSYSCGIAVRSPERRGNR